MPWQAPCDRYGYTFLHFLLLYLESGRHRTVCSARNHSGRPGQGTEPLPYHRLHGRDGCRNGLSDNFPWINPFFSKLLYILCGENGSVNVGTIPDCCEGGVFCISMKSVALYCKKILFLTLKWTKKPYKR